VDPRLRRWLIGALASLASGEPGLGFFRPQSNLVGRENLDDPRR
jgi:hypothetical protein